MIKQLRVMQMIDSLSIGGAERVSVNYANALAEIDECESFHCATREEGMLKIFLSQNVKTFFMNKQGRFDIAAHIRLIKYVKANKINIIHAHSSSFFTALIVKLFTGIKIIWHDHYGKSEALEKRPILMLKLASTFFSYIIVVNNLLATWSKKYMLVPENKVEYIPNYADLNFDDTVPDIPGSFGNRVVVLANLRAQKDHLNILRAFKKIVENSTKEWTLLLVGRDFEDAYSNSLKAYIKANELENYIFILGGRNDTSQILKNSNLGVLCSESEGLPVTLLEYGLASLCPIATNVGECKAVLDDGKIGRLVASKDSNALAEAMEEMMLNRDKRLLEAKKFHSYVNEHYSKDKIVLRVIALYRSVVK